MKKWIVALPLVLFSSLIWSHEQWLLSTKEMHELSQAVSPLLFTHVTVFNIVLCSVAFIGLIIWVFITRDEKTRLISKKQRDYALFGLRAWIGLMLLLCGLGLLPKTTVAVYTEPTLFAPDLLIHSLPSFWHVLKWIEVGLGIWLMMGIFTRMAAGLLLVLIFFALGLYGTAMLQYSGFYLGAALFLIINGGGSLSLQAVNMTPIPPLSLLLLQFLTGVNFIYSALTVKWLTPTVDIFLLQKKQAFTFGMSYDKFVFLMLTVEVGFGLLIILGRQLRLVSLSLLCLFLFLSINLSENVLSHSFIYGILTVFIILEGYPLLLKFK